MINKFYFLALALTGCAVAASAYAIRHFSRRQEAQQDKDDLNTWEGEGGQTGVTGGASCPSRLSYWFNLFVRMIPYITS